MDGLPEELLREISFCVAAEPVSASKSACVNTTWHALFSDPQLVHRAALMQQVAAWPAQCPSGATWELMHLHMAVDALAPRCSNRCGFVYASIALDSEDGAESHVLGTRARIEGFAKLAARHPKVTIHVDAHCGTGAPAFVAEEYSSRRANLVRDELAAKGLPRERVTCTGHGKAIAVRALASTHPNAESARAGFGWAELYVHYGGCELPPRPDFYPSRPAVLSDAVAYPAGQARRARAAFAAAAARATAAVEGQPRPSAPSQHSVCAIC